MSQNFLLKRFQTGDVLRAANVTNDQLQSWIRRGFIVGSKGEGVEMTGSPGKYRSYSFYTIMQIAVAKALTDEGVPVKQAFRAALVFSHTGSETRNPGFPYHDGSETLLCVSGERSAVIKIKEDIGLFSQVKKALGKPLAFVSVFTNSIFDQVAFALGEHPVELIEYVTALTPHVDFTVDDDEGELLPEGE